MNSSYFDFDTMPETPTQVGTVRRFFQTPTTLLAELESHATTLNAGNAPHTPHRHREEEFIIVKAGTLEVFLNGAMVRVEAGAMLFFASNEWHGLKNVGTEPATYYVIRWNTPE